MPLTPGVRLGSYEILSALGAGGMGEVYRARDTKLNRDVALKVLPDAFANDPDRLARFTREARALAALNHPHIAHIHGLQESLSSTGSGPGAITALVMELVDGEDLANRLARGRIPLEEALPVARQIAEALEAAHEQGIVHRDLKPANIKIRADGAVKVLDFGLAKALDPGSSSPAAAALGASPTITSPAMTAAGIILGTAAYMSPEQARGKPVDKRADIWAFGCVLYEMLTGSRAFGGDDVTETIAAVVRAEPEWHKLPADTPAAVRRLLRRCLEKDRLRRLADAADARLEIDEALNPVVADSSVERAAQPASSAVVAGRGRSLPWATVAVLGVALVLVLWAPWDATPPPRVTRTSIPTSGPAALTVTGLDRSIAVSPDGRHVIYVGNNGTQLFVRPLEALEPVAIVTNSAGLRAPVVSPDSQWVGFIVGGKTLQRIAITGGSPVTLTTLDATPRGLTWGSDDSIVFGTIDRATGLQRVSAASASAGATAEVLTRPDRAHGEADHFLPEVLPGGRAVLFTLITETGPQVTVRDLRTGAQKFLLRGASDARYLASGHLVYVEAGSLRAISFDPDRLETHGRSVPLEPRLATSIGGAGEFAMARDGTLLYVEQPGGIAAKARTLVWVDRAGNEKAVAAPPRAYEHPRLSPDGTRVALWISDQEDDVWILDLARPGLTRLTTGPKMDRFPLWTLDNQRVVFGSSRDGALNLWWQAADNTGTAQRLTTSNNPQFPSGITEDGKILFSETTPANRSDVLEVTVDGTRAVTSRVHANDDERNGVVSPGGRWLAYESTRSGPYEVYVQPVGSAGGGGVQVSTAGGTRPLWSRSGEELFYLDANGALMRVPVKANGATWHHGQPTKLLEAGYHHTGTSGRTYDVSLDGQRFLMIKEAPTRTAPTLVLVQHWDEDLKRLLPTK